MSSSPGSVTRILPDLKDGDAAAQQQLWDRYFHRLVGLARSKIRGRRLPEGSEDIALGALDSVLDGAKEGRFPLLTDRDNLWRLLVVITLRKAGAAIKREGAGKRPKLVSFDALISKGDSQAEAIFNQMISRDPAPGVAALLVEQFERRLDQLRDEKLQKIAVWKLEGYTNKEIAKKLGCVVETVERKLTLIRATWKEENRP
jgi:DNA-directed RNA polymerase specialized sigma24 family protein